VSEKQVVFDTDGNPKELRYYEHDKLTARLGVILDGDKNFIGLRELDVAEVSPPSWLERLGLKKAVQPKRIDILTVDFIGLINWINTIKTIKTIETVSNVDLLKEITTIKNIESVDLIDLITRIALIDNITNVGTLNLLNTVNLIKSISSIDNITNIANVQSVDLIDAITSIDNITNIKRIGYAHAPAFDIFTGYLLSNSTIAWSDVYNCYLVTFTIAAGKITFETKPILGTRLSVSYHAFNGDLASTRTVYCKFYFSDATTEEFSHNIPPETDSILVDTPTTAKTVVKVEFRFSASTSDTYIYGVRAYVKDVVDAVQATRTSLKVQTEREDLLCKSFDLTVGTTSLLAAVANQYHKVYGWDYESDTDGANEFSATINATANTKFGRRVTKGVHAMTLVHPIVCDVNTALSFVSAGNTKLSLRYKTEA